MHRRIRAVLPNLALLGGSLLVGFLIGEAFLRLFPHFLPQEVRLRIFHNEGAASERVTRAHSRLGFLGAPMYRGEVETRDFHYTFRTDEHGFRNPSPWPPRAEIVCVGNSMVFGYGVSDDQAWTSRVASRLPNGRLINLGMPGAAPQQYVRIYEAFGIPLGPKLLIFGLFPGNDVADARSFADWEEAGARGNYLIWRISPGRVPRLSPTPGQVPKRFAGLRATLRRSYLLSAARAIVRDWRSPFSNRTLRLQDGGRLQLVPVTATGFESMTDPSHPDFQLTLRAVEEARERTREHGTELLVLLFPTKEEVYLPLLGEPVPHGVATFASELRERGIRHLDLTPRLQEAARRGQTLFFEVDGHPNAAGYRLIADIVLEDLHRNADRYGLEDWP